MLRRTARLRKEFLYRKNLEKKQKEILEKKKIVRENVKKNKRIPTEIKAAEAASLYKVLDLDDINRQNNLQTHIDDEYAYAGITDPKILVTTCRNPSSRLTQFAKEIKLIFPNAEKVNRGNYLIKDLVQLAKTHHLSDIVILHEHRGIPDGMIVSHMPLGPTAYFSIVDVTMRHDLPEKPQQMSLVNPHLIFENFTSHLGARVANILRFLFPAVKTQSKRVCTFFNENDVIHFRHHTWAEPTDDTGGEEGEEGEKGEKGEGENDGKHESHDKITKKKVKKGIELTEVGPRMSFRLYRLDIGTLDEKFAETEWTLRPYFNKQKYALTE